MVTVVVRKLNGAQLTLSLRAGATLADVKAQLASQWDVPDEEQQLIADGVIKDDLQCEVGNGNFDLIRMQPLSVYILGGLGEDNQALSSVERFSPEAFRWEPVEQLTSPRRFCAGAAVDGMIFIVGGCGPNGRCVATVDRLEPSTGRWSALPPMPRGARYGCAAAGLSGHLYILGGGDDDGDLATAERFDTRAEAWEDLPLLSGGPRRCCAAATLAGAVYVVGGNGGAPPLRRVVRTIRGYVLRSAERFDPTLGRWERMPPMSGPRRGCAAVGACGALYVIGGGDGAGQIMASVERLVPSEGRWEKLMPMQAPRYGCVAAVVGGSICVFGGSAGGRGATMAAECVMGTAERYDEQTAQWQWLPSMSVPRHSCAAVAV